jgi:hypothetical protein
MQRGDDRMASHLVRHYAARIPIFALLGLTVLLFAFPGAAAANTNEQIAQTGGMTASFRLLGTSLTVGVQLDAVGKISLVTLDPNGLVTAKKTTDHSVRFANTDDSVKVTVRAKGSSLSISARSTLEGLSGPGTWSADVLGTGAKSTVNYTVGSNGGAPTLTIDSVSAASGITATTTAPAAKSGTKSAWAGGKVTFARAGYTKRLMIFVGVDAKSGKAVLSIVLSGRDKLKLDGSPTDLAGARTWSAHLCDGTAVSVAYHVAADGTVVFDSSTGAPAKQKTFKSGFVVRFTDTNVGVFVGLKKTDTGYRLIVFGNSGHCGKAGGGDDKHGDNDGRHHGHGKHHHGWWDAFGFGGNAWGKHG